MFLEIQKSLQPDGSSLQDITRGVDNKEYETILDRLIELLKTDDNSNIQREGMFLQLAKTHSVFSGSLGSGIMLILFHKLNN